MVAGLHDDCRGRQLQARLREWLDMSAAVAKLCKKDGRQHSDRATTLTTGLERAITLLRALGKVQPTFEEIDTAQRQFAELG